MKESNDGIRNEIDRLVDEVENSPPPKKPGVIVSIHSPPGTSYQDVVSRLRALADHIERSNRTPPRFIAALERLWFRLKKPRT